MRLSIWRRVLALRLAAPLRKTGAALLKHLRITAVARLANGRLLKVDLASSVGRSIWLRGIYEPEVKALMDKILEPGDAFVDVGANLGYFSIIGSDAVGVDGEVHSFEANGETFELFKGSVELNSLSNVRSNHVALWDEQTFLSLSVGRDSSFCHVLPHSSVEGLNVPGKVQAMTFDEYAKRTVRRPIKLIKIDVDGAEYRILRGMQATLASEHPKLIVEALDWTLERFGNSLDDIFTLLGGFDYRAFDLNGHPLRDVEEARLSLRTRWVPNLLFEAAPSRSN